MSNMSDRLRGTLENISNANSSSEDIDVDFNESDIIPAKGVELVPFKPKEVPTSVPVVHDNTDIRDDYIKSRNITHSLIDMAGSAIQGALDVAIQTQHPKAFGIFNELATTMRGLSKDLLDMQKVYKEISADKEAANQREAQSKKPNTTVVNIHQNLSLSDVLKLSPEEQARIIDAETVEVKE